MLMLLPAQQDAEAVLFVDVVLDVDVVVNDIFDIVVGVAIVGDFVAGFF